MHPDKDRLSQSVQAVAHTDFTILRKNLTVQEALADIRRRGMGEKIVYFYVVDTDDRLVGVVPTRRLLTAPLEQRLADIMVARVLTIPADATVMDACEWFILYKFLAFPVVDKERRIVGVVDVSLLTDEVFDVAERARMDEVFEAIGFRVAQVRDASPLKAFRFRFPWLVSTILSGILCAVLVQAFEATLAHWIVLAFFLTLVLGLSESVSIQSMTVAIQALRTMRPTWGWYARTLRREAGTAVLLGIASGLLVGLVVWLWRGDPLPACAIGGSIAMALVTACVSGLSVPALLHALKLDPKIAAGPATLACTDICTLLFYFGLAAILLT